DGAAERSVAGEPGRAAWVPGGMRPSDRRPGRWAGIVGRAERAAAVVTGRGVRVLVLNRGALVARPAEVAAGRMHDVHLFPGRQADVADIDGPGIAERGVAGARPGPHAEAERVPESVGPHP